MHEWALAESVIVTAIKEAERNKYKDIDKIQVKIGELQQIDLEIFKFALENVLRIYNLSLDAEKIELVIEQCVLRCKVCGKEWSFREIGQNLETDETEAIHFIPEVAHIFLRCPGCGTPDFEIIKGRGVWIEYVEYVEGEI